MLTRVTITGADDAVDPNDLLELTREFPFVEWGILHSLKRAGTPRYPSDAWMSRLPPLPLSIHFCGTGARAILDADPHTCVPYLRGLPPNVRRVQINGYSPADSTIVRIAKRWPNLEFILQVRAEDELVEAAHQANCIVTSEPRGQASLLFDASGGRGIEPARWPTRPFGAIMGYAGGINPENVLDVLRAIGPVTTPFWIDMESGVRTDDRFDLAKVRAVLYAASNRSCEAPIAPPADSPLSEAMTRVRRVLAEAAIAAGAGPRREVHDPLFPLLRYPDWNTKLPADTAERVGPSALAEENRTLRKELRELRETAARLTHERDHARKLAEWRAIDDRDTRDTAIEAEDVSWMTAEDLLFHYQAALMNWNLVIDERDAARAERGEALALLDAARSSANGGGS